MSNDATIKKPDYLPEKNQHCVCWFGTQETIDKKYENADEVVVILDNASYHHSKEVKKLEEESPRLRLVFLPPYSPELNLIERVWKFFKKKVLYNQYYENLQAFRQAAIKFFSNIADYENELRSILDGDFENIYT